MRSAVLCSAKNSRVELERVGELLGHLEVGEDRVDRAGLDAGVAVDADLGVDVELLGRLEVGRARLRMDAVDGTDLDAGVVLDAAAGDDVGHGPTGLQTIGPGAPERDEPGRAPPSCVLLDAGGALVTLEAGTMLGGGSGKDALSGGSGKDRLAGGSGRDSCSGNSGKDSAACERQKSI